MVQIPFRSLESAFAVLWLAVRIFLWLLRGRVDWKREALLLLMYVNLAILLRFSFFPMARADGRVQPLLFDPAAVYPFRINAVPFVMLTDYDSRRDLLLNLIGNVGMFIPSGILLPILYKRLHSFWRVLAAGAIMSLCIELLQLPFAVRASDVDDLILNTLGVAIGYGICNGVRRLIRRRTATADTDSEGGQTKDA